MKAARLFTCLTACLLLTLAASAQQTAPNPRVAACGITGGNYSIKHVPDSWNIAQPPAGKALVYIIENVTATALGTKKIDIGLDGTWIGGTDAETHISFAVAPGVHHLCAAVQSNVEEIDYEERIVLLHLNAQAGHTYYLRYHALILNGAAAASFEPIDEDEGLYLFQNTNRAVFTLKK